MSEPQVFEASEADFTPCDVCTTINQWNIVKTHRKYGDITHHDVVCRVCRSPAIIFND